MKGIRYELIVSGIMEREREGGGGGGGLSSELRPF